MSPSQPERRQFLARTAGTAAWVGAAGWLGIGLAHGRTLADTATVTPRAYRAPPPARWNYAVEAQMRGIPLKAQAHMEWAHDGERYRASSEFQAPLLGKRRQTSTGRIGVAGLLPERFTDESRRLRSVEFDHARAQVLYAPGSGGSHNGPLPTGMQDRLSLFLQLAGWLAGATQGSADALPPSPGSVWVLPVAGRSDSEPWAFEWLAAQALTVPAGSAQAWPLRRQPRNPGDETLELWLVPAWGFAPARIQVREPEGDVVNQLLTQRL